MGVAFTNDENLKEVLEYGGYHEEQGFTCFEHGPNGDFDKIDARSGIEISDRQTSEQYNQEEKDKKQAVNVRHAFYQTVLGNTPLSQFQNNVMKGLVGDNELIDLRAQQSVDPEKAKEVLNQTKELIEDSPETAEHVQRYHAKALTDDSGRIMVTRADVEKLQEEKQMSFVEVSLEETNEMIASGNVAGLEARVGHINPGVSILGQDQPSNPHFSPVETPDPIAALMNKP